MLYPKEKRLEIGKKVYTKEITIPEACKEYGLKKRTIYNYLDDYKKANNIPVRKPSTCNRGIKTDTVLSIDDYMAMSKEELIRELILSKANELRAKKGYEVKGDGVNKEFVPLNNKNSKS